MADTAETNQTKALGCLAAAAIGLLMAVGALAYLGARVWLDHL